MWGAFRGPVFSLDPGDSIKGFPGKGLHGGCLAWPAEGWRVCLLPSPSPARLPSCLLLLPARLPSLAASPGSSGPRLGPSISKGRLERGRRQGAN